LREIALPILEMVNVSKSYGTKPVVKHVDLRLDRGRILAVMGPNGSGKTTLIKLADLLIRPTEGKIIFDGVDTDCGGSQRRALRRKMSVVFQRPALFSMSVEDNISVGLSVRGVNDKEIRRRVEEVLTQMELLELRGRRARTLSGGEAQRVSVARALATRPELLLLDEPTASSDPRNASIIEKAIAESNSGNGTGVLIATHNPHQAKRLASETAFLFEGGIVERGSTASVLESPEDERTAAYVSGKMA